MLHKPTSAVLGKLHEYSGSPCKLIATFPQLFGTWNYNKKFVTNLASPNKTLPGAT